MRKYHCRICWMLVDTRNKSFIARHAEGHHMCVKCYVNDNSNIHPNKFVLRTKTVVKVLLKMKPVNDDS
jgi:hypothetical protein